jgi:hypothetical protein
MRIGFYLLKVVKEMAQSRHATCLRGAFLRAHQRIKEKAAKVKKLLDCHSQEGLQKLHVKKTVIYQ